MKEERNKRSDEGQRKERKKKREKTWRSSCEMDGWAVLIAEL